MSSTQEPTTPKTPLEQPVAQSASDGAYSSDAPMERRRLWQRDWSAALRNTRGRWAAGVAALVLAAGLGGFAVGHAVADDGGNRGGQHHSHRGR